LDSSKRTSVTHPGQEPYTRARQFFILGERLSGQAFRLPQAYSQSAGRFINRLIREGKVRRVFPVGWQDRAPQYEAIP
jgi:hypothetical protein